MNFSQYTLDNFYRKHYYEGGLHLDQIQLMYEHVTQQKYNDYKFFAGLSGIDLDKESKKQSQSSETALEKQQKQQDLPLFKDPNEYANCTQEELNEMTQKMMGKHRQWAHGQSNILGVSNG